MNRVCGVEIKSNVACLIILEGKKSDFKLIKSLPLKIELSDSASQESIKDFSGEINKFIEHNKVDEIVIKEGISKGKFTSGSSVFKIETIMQLSNIKVSLVKSISLNAFYKKVELDLSKYTLKKYQHVAYQVAYYGLNE